MLRNSRVHFFTVGYFPLYQGGLFLSQGEPDMLKKAESFRLECGAEVTELSLLVPQAQAEMLERKARRHGMTLGQLLRRMITTHPVFRSPELDRECASA